MPLMLQPCVQRSKGKPSVEPAKSPPYFSRELSHLVATCMERSDLKRPCARELLFHRFFVRYPPHKEELKQFLKQVSPLQICQRVRSWCCTCHDTPPFVPLSRACGRCGSACTSTPSPVEACVCLRTLLWCRLCGPPRYTVLGRMACSGLELVSRA